MGGVEVFEGGVEVFEGGVEVFEGVSLMDGVDEEFKE